ncbi:MAG: hypothetical protein CL434_11260 [Acidimicrobiaceae bacterium]|nr:hypothetical protein [Acidimicrobiaceae bacterium]|tara:strand:+ start:164 stop:607 length:444 start_codon:yes stop_codon:yes gene_type:complete
MSDESGNDSKDEIEPDSDALDDETGDEFEGDPDEEGLLPEGEEEDEDNTKNSAGARPVTDDEDEDEDDDEVEADLDTILKERLSSAEDEDDEEEDEGVITTAEGDRIPSKQEDEILCEGCFLLVKESQYDTRDNVPSCPHCGTQLNV